MELKEVKEAKEEGGWEGRETATKKGHHTCRGKYGTTNYAPTHPKLEAAAASSDLEPEIAFTFGGKEAIETAFGCTELAFAVLARGYLLVLVHWCRYR